MLQEAGLIIPDYIGMDNLQRPLRHASEFWDHYGVTVHETCRAPGDLILFSRNGLFPTHIGILQDETSYIHSPGLDDTVVSKALLDAIQPPRLRSASSGKVLYAANPIGYKAPVIKTSEPSYRYHQVVI